MKGFNKIKMNLNYWFFPKWYDSGVLCSKLYTLCLFFSFSHSELL